MSAQNILSNVKDDFNATKISNLAIHAVIESAKGICVAGNQPEHHLGFESEKKRNIGARICSNCGTSSTSTWRNLGNQIVCNACKCFYRKHGKNRPIHMRKDTIITRHRKACKLSVPNEVIFTVKDEPNQNLLEFDSGAVAEVMCLMLQYLKNP